MNRKNCFNRPFLSPKKSPLFGLRFHIEGFTLSFLAWGNSEMPYLHFTITTILLLLLLLELSFFIYLSINILLVLAAFKSGCYGNIPFQALT